MFSKKRKKRRQFFTYENASMIIPPETDVHKYDPKQDLFIVL